MMEVETKLKVCVVFSILAVILKTIVFVSPGWVVVKHSVRRPLITDVKQQQAMEKTKVVSMSFGMWYYRVCSCDLHPPDNEDTNGDRDDNTRHKRHQCYYRTYCKRRFQRIDYVGETFDEATRNDKIFENNVPREFFDASDFIVSAVDFARHAQHELAAYVTIGLILGVMGMAGAIRYALGRGTGKHSGRLACSSQVFSSFFFWMAIVRAATYVVQLKAVGHHVDYRYRDDVWFTVPWCLVVGTFGAILMDIAALFHLIMISRDRKPAGAEYILNTEQIGDRKVPLVTPTGYLQLIVPALSSTDAGPLPEKKSLA